VFWSLQPKLRPERFAVQRRKEHFGRKDHKCKGSGVETSFVDSRGWKSAEWMEQSQQRDMALGRGG
jgi:hypothetical protein